MIRNAIVLATAAALISTLSAQGRQTTSIFSDDAQNRKYEYAFVQKNGSSTCFGAWDELQRIEAGSQGDRIIVRKGEKVYAITDRQTVDSAKKELQPVIDLGLQQGVLGRRQGELGEKQGELGRQMGVLGERQGEATREYAKAPREYGQADGEGAKTYKKTMKSLSDQMKQLGAKMRALGEQQSKLGRQQGALGRKQGQACRKADEAITELIDRAFEKGLAKEVP